MVSKIRYQITKRKARQIPHELMGIFLPSITKISTNIRQPKDNIIGWKGLSTLTSSFNMRLKFTKETPIITYTWIKEGTKLWTYKEWQCPFSKRKKFRQYLHSFLCPFSKRKAKSGLVKDRHCRTTLAKQLQEIGRVKFSHFYNYKPICHNLTPSEWNLNVIHEWYSC